MNKVCYEEKLISFLLAQFTSSPKIEGLIKSYGRQLNELEEVFVDLMQKRWIETSEGKQLDGCGEIVGQSRLINVPVQIPYFGFYGQENGRGFEQARMRSISESTMSTAKLADEEYRTMIYAKIAKNTGHGKAEELISSLSFLFKGAKIVITEAGNAKIRVGIGRKLLESEVYIADRLNLLIRSAGIGIDLKSYFDNEKTFGFDDQNMGYKGFNEGIFARTF